MNLIPLILVALLLSFAFVYILRAERRLDATLASIRPSWPDPTDYPEVTARTLTDGWYWMDDPDNRCHLVVHVNVLQGVIAIDGDLEIDNYDGCCFYGPIPSPWQCASRPWNPHFA